MSTWDKNILLSRLPNLPISPAGEILWPGKRREGKGWPRVLIHHFIEPKFFCFNAHLIEPAFIQMVMVCRKKRQLKKEQMNLM